MGLSKDIDELKDAGVISEETAEGIRAYYHQKEGFSTNRLFMVFGVLGAVLVGSGIILIIAHNWDELSRTIKTVFAFLPLIAGQALCVYARYKRKDSRVWRESSATFLCFAVAACISLISQIYHIPGELGGFLLVWMLLSIPLIYLMDASVVSLLCLVGITWYACETSYWHYPKETSYPYWAMMGFVLPHYIGLFKTRPSGNATYIHHWFVPLSFVIALGTLVEAHGIFMYLAYMCLFGLLYLIGKADPLEVQVTARNGFKVTGVVGMIILLLTSSFDSFWETTMKAEWSAGTLLLAPEVWAGFVLFAVAIYLLIKSMKQRAPNTPPDHMAWVFAVFTMLFIVGLFTKFPVFLVNVLLFALGIQKIREGNRRDHLGVMNFGLLIIIALITCRFLDTDLTFIARGLLFIVVGSGCFLANYYMLKRRRTHA